MRAHASALLLALAITLAPGCAVYRLEPRSSDELGQYTSVTAHGFCWGLFMSPEPITVDCESTINDVQVVRNWGYDWISVLTLGLWMPLELRYRCHAGPTDTVDFPDAPTEPTVEVPGPPR